MERNNRSAFVSQAVNDSFKDLRRFVETKEFQSLLAELYDKPVKERKNFINEIILNNDELAKRNVRVPSGLTIQRSAFADKRPTLFCVTAKLPKECIWEKTTFTFDNEVSRKE